MLIEEEIGKKEMLDLLEQLYQKMKDTLQFSNKALVSFDFEDDDDKSLKGCSIRALGESGYSDQSLHFGFIRADVD